MLCGVKPRVLVVGYSPNPRDSGGVPVGMILVDRVGSPGKILRTRFLHDWTLLRSKCPGADVDILKGIADDIENCCANGQHAGSLLESIESFSNSLSILSEEDADPANLDSSFEAVASRVELGASSRRGTS